MPNYIDLNIIGVMYKKYNVYSFKTVKEENNVLKI